MKAISVLLALLLSGIVSLLPVTAFAGVDNLCTTTITTSGLTSVTWPNSTDCPLAGTTFSGNNCGATFPDATIFFEDVAGTGAGVTQNLLIQFASGSTPTLDTGAHYYYDTRHAVELIQSANQRSYIDDDSVFVFGGTAGLAGVFPASGAASGALGMGSIEFGGMGRVETSGAYGFHAISYYRAGTTASRSESWGIDSGWVNPDTTTAVKQIKFSWDSGGFATGSTMSLSCS